MSPTDPPSEDVAFGIDGDTDHCVDGPVGDLANADLDHDRIDENHRIDALESCFEDLLGQPGQQAASGDQIDPVRVCLGDELLRERTVDPTAARLDGTSTTITSWSVTVCSSG